MGAEVVLETMPLRPIVGQVLSEPSLCIHTKVSNRRFSIASNVPPPLCLRTCTARNLGISSRLHIAPTQGNQVELRREAVRCVCKQCQGSATDVSILSLNVRLQYTVKRTY